MRGFETSIYFMMAMLFVGMPATVIGGIAWECRKQSRAAGTDEAGEPISESTDADLFDPPAKPR